MKLLYSNENRFIVSNIQNIIENSGIDINLKNEFIAGAAGDLAPLDTWMEIWVDDKDYTRAINIINALELNNNLNDWVCNSCHEKNSSSFEICWQCQNEKPLSD